MFTASAKFLQGKPEDGKVSFKDWNLPELEQATVKSTIFELALAAAAEAVRYACEDQDAYCYFGIDPDLGNSGRAITDPAEMLVSLPLTNEDETYPTWCFRLDHAIESLLNYDWDERREAAVKAVRALLVQQIELIDKKLAQD